MNDLSNFNEIFRNVIYIISKVRKKQGFTLSIEKREYIFGKTTRGVKLAPSLIKLRENLQICKFAKQDKNDQ